MARSLWPREHGAYAQLAAPIGAALLAGAPGWSGGLLAVAAIAAFLANEPLLVVLGHRGARLRERDGRRAMRRLALLASLALPCAVLGLGLAGAATLALAALAAVPLALLVVLAWRRGQHSVGGEIVAAVALPAAAAPIAAASGIAPGVAIELWLAWSIGYAASVLAVHRVIERHRNPASAFDRLLALGLGGALVALVMSASRLVLAAPLVALSAALVVAPPHAKYLRTIGVALVAASLGAIAIAVHMT